MSEKRKYQTFAPEEKAEIVLAGLRGDRTVRDVCREYDIAETLYYQWRERGDHPGAIGRVRTCDLNDRFVTRSALAGTGRCRPTGRGAVGRLTADASDACHHRRRVPLGGQPAGLGDTLTHSQSRNSLPAISNS